MKTTENILKELDDLKIFTNKEYTYTEYVEQLKKLHDYVIKEIFQEEYHPSLRMTDAIYRLKMECIKHEMVDTVEFKKCENAMNIINKEIAISMSGKSGEDKVDWFLKKYVDRPDYRNYRNVSLVYEDDVSEIDNLILTENGFIILEIKKVKSNVTIDENGRLFHGKDVSYDKSTLAEKMKCKRKLFRNNLQKVLNEKGYDIDIYLDSYVVFTSNSGIQFYVDDLYKKEKWCTSKKLTYLINEYSSDIKYSKEELQRLNECVLLLEKKDKRFDTNEDFNCIKESIAILLGLLNSKKVSKSNVEKKERSLKTEYNLKRKKAFDMTKLAFAVTGLTAAVVISALYKN